MADNADGRRACRVAVIGAGAAGLITARELLREGHAPVVFEQGARIGGTWVYSDATDSDELGADPKRTRVHSSLYSGLRTNLPRWVMSVSDFPFSPATMGPGYSIDARMYPCHEEVLRYLDAFADHYGLLPLIRFNTHVVRASPLPLSAAAAASGGPEAEWRRRWAVETRPAAADGSGSEGTVEEFDAVIVANGHFSEPHLPEVPGAAGFPGRQLHSHNYRRPEHFAGQRVAVVGASFSALDIAKHVAASADRVYICTRAWASPRQLGRPYGPRANMERRGMITRLRADGGADFAVGERVGRLDAVIYCTGYEYSYPFLDLEALGLSTAQQHVAPLFQHLFTPAYGPGLAFVGLPFRAAAFPMFELQCKLCARLLSGRASLPPSGEMEAWIKSADARRAAEGLPPSAAHRFDHRQLEHHAYLARACGPDVSYCSGWRGAALCVYWVAAGVAFAAGQLARRIAAAVEAASGRARKLA